MRQEGYLLVDHSASPGIPAEMAIAMGRNPKLYAEGKRAEEKTLTCAHCTNVVVKNVNRVRERGHCQKCNAYVCDNCFAASKAPLYSHENYLDMFEKVFKQSPVSQSIILP